MNNTNSHNSISYKSSSHNNNGRRNNAAFGPDGCQVVIDGKRCGETKNLQIIKEFRKLYEDKMRLIDDIAGGDSIQAKVNLQQEWIKDLTDQNEMLVKVVEELEVEAAERVNLLEKKLDQSAKCACKVMESYRDFSTNFLGDLQKMGIVQSDLNNLVELIRRAKRDGVWNVEGLRFNSVNINDILRPSTHQMQTGNKNHPSYKKDEWLKEKDRRIKQLEQQLQPYLDEDSKIQKDSQSLKDNYAELQKSMLDMRDALTAEVADKHDTIICLRREVHLLEEQCKKAEQQTHFKDDIIKELRRELKQYKHHQLQDDADMLRLKNSIEGNHLILRHVRQVRKASVVKEDKEVQTPPVVDSDNKENQEKVVNDPPTTPTSTIACNNCPKIQYNKDKYIVDQSALIILLVHKLYVVYRSLRELEGRLTFMLTEGKPDGKVMEAAIIDAKNKLAELEERSLAYLKERDELRLKNEQMNVTIEGLQKEIAAYKDNLRKSMESLIETQRELVKSKENVNRERERSRENSRERSSDKSTNEPDEVESQLMRENSELKEIAVALRQESQVLARENSKMKENLHELEKEHNNQMDEVHQILINELESLESQHQQTLAQLERLRSELGDAKKAHQMCMEKIQELGRENEELKKQLELLKKRDHAQNFSVDESPEYASDVSCETTDYVNASGNAKQSVASSASTAPCVSADATVNTDSTWTGLVTCEGEPDSQKETIATETEKKPLAIFTCSNSYIDAPPKENVVKCAPPSVICSCSEDVEQEMIRVKGGASHSSSGSCSCTEEEEDVVAPSAAKPTAGEKEVLELMGPRKTVPTPKKGYRPSSQDPSTLTVESDLQRLEESDHQLTTEPAHDRTSSVSLPAKIEAYDGAQVISTKSSTEISCETLDGRYKIADDATSSNMLVASEPPPTKIAPKSTKQQSTSSPVLEPAIPKDVITDPETTTLATSTPTLKQQNEISEATPDSADAPCQVLYQKEEKAVTAVVICDAHVGCGAPTVDELTQYSQVCVAGPAVEEKGIGVCPVQSMRSAQAVESNPVSLQCRGADTVCTNTGGDSAFVDSYTSGVDDEVSQTVTAMTEVGNEAKLVCHCGTRKPRKMAGRKASEDLKGVVKDLNASVSRIMEKPTERDAKARIKYLEDQLRAALMQKEQAVELERRRRGQEVENLKLTIQQMDVALKNKDQNSANLQSAVDLYANSVNVLEEADARYRTEIAQQRVTIANLQDALVATKQELEDLREKFKQDREHSCELMRILDMNIRDLENLCLHYYYQFTNIVGTTDCLRDENLDLEVARNDLIQDVSMLESRLLKYQQNDKLSEIAENVKEEMVRLKYENQMDAVKISALENDVSFYMAQSKGVKAVLMKIVGECECDGDYDDTDEDIITLAHEVERLVDTLQAQIGLAIATLEREQKINQQNADRMDQLQVTLEDKEEHFVLQRQRCQEIEMNLEAAGVRNARLEQAVRELQEMLKGSELDQKQYTEPKVDEGGDCLDSCLSNLNVIKQKVRAQSQTVAQNKDQLKDLRDQFQVQVNTMEMYKRDLENTRARYREEVVELQKVIRELSDKLKAAELRISNLTEENKQVQSLLCDCQKREKSTQQELLIKNQEFGNNLKNWKKEETRLVDHIRQLEQELHDAQHELTGRTSQIDSAKSKLQQISNDATMRYQMGQEELLAAKNEINHLRQVHERLKADNERLQQQVQALKGQAHQQENINATVNMQLDKCMCDLKRIEADKYYLEQKNEKLGHDLDKVQMTLHCKCENVKSLEDELKSLKSNREEIRKESHHVVCNVRAWLEEQKKINDQLKEKLWKKNALIIKYQQEQRPHANSKSAGMVSFRDCKCNNSGSRMGSIRDAMRQRGGAAEDFFDEDRRLPFTAAWSLGSRGSDSDSATSSVFDASADWYDEDTECTLTSPCDEPGTHIWIHKVESMTHDLRRSNRYWKKKIADSEFMVSKDI